MWIVALSAAAPLYLRGHGAGHHSADAPGVLRTPVDIFPDINIPVVSVVWNFTGFAPSDMADRIITNSERGMTVTVNNIEHIESQSVNGVGVIKIFFQPDANIQTALAQVTAIVQTTVRSLPPGTTPPLVITYTASSTPIVQLGISSKTLPDQVLFDLGQNFLRNQLATVQGAATPYPYGGKIRQVQVDLDMPRLEANGLSPSDIVNAINAQNVITPSGTAKIGSLEYQVEMNSAPKTIADLNDLPVKTINGSTIYMRDVAHVRDGFAPQTNIVRQDGVHGVLMSMYKIGKGSTLTIVKAVKGHGAHRAAVAAAGSDGQAAVRSVAVCAGVDQRRVARRPDRRGADRVHDPAVPGRLAADHRHLDFDSAVDLRFRAAAERAGRDHQHHDARRSGAGGRNSGGRRDGGN